MTEIRKSYDGGFSENLFFTDNYEQDFIDVKGFEKWTAYKKEWDQYTKLEREVKYPPHLEFELNYSCNLRCPMCTWSAETAVEKPKDWFKLEDYKKIIDEAVSNGTKSVRLCFINEPLIRKDIDQFVKYASDAGILDIIITTNGTLLTKEVSKRLIEAGLTKLSVSLDAVTEETYNKIRVGGDFNTTIKNIHDFLEIRKNLNSKLPKLRLSFVRTKLNEGEYRSFVEYWKDKADSLGIQNLQDPFAEGKFQDPSRSEGFSFGNKITPPKQFHCPEPYKRMTLRSNGDVLACCSFYAVDLVVGNWKTTDIEKIWNGDQMIELRRIHKNGEYYKNRACKMCVENSSFVFD